MLDRVCFFGVLEPWVRVLGLVIAVIGVAPSLEVWRGEHELLETIETFVYV